MKRAWFAAVLAVAGLVGVATLGSFAQEKKVAAAGKDRLFELRVVGATDQATAKQHRRDHTSRVREEHPAHNCKEGATADGA